MEYDDEDLEAPSIVRFSENPYCESPSPSPPSLPLPPGDVEAGHYVSYTHTRTRHQERRNA